MISDRVTNYVEVGGVAVTVAIVAFTAWALSAETEQMHDDLSQRATEETAWDRDWLDLDVLQHNNLMRSVDRIRSDIAVLEAKLDRERRMLNLLNLPCESRGSVNGS